MSTQAAAVSRQRAEAAEYSFAEALSLSSKDSFQLLSKGELGLPPSPNSPSTNHNTYSIFPERTLAERTLPEKNSP